MEYKTKNRTIYEMLFIERSILLDAFMLVLGIAFLAAMANIKIPLWPVPITMQTFGVFALAFFFGSRKGSLSILLYTLAGILGIGVFAGFKSGTAAVFGPTFGYIVGFTLAAFFVGKMIEKGYGRTKASVFKVVVIGNLIIYAFGLIWLWNYLGNPGIAKLLMAGLVPFLIGDTVKIIAAVGLFPYIWKGAEKIAK